MVAPTVSFNILKELVEQLFCRYLLETLDPSKINPQDVRTVLAVVAANPEGRLLAWRHLKAYWPAMQTLFGNATYMMGGLISAVTAHLSIPYDYHEVFQRFERNLHAF